MLNVLRSEKIIIVTHVFATGPAQELEEFLKDKVKELLFIGHPFSYAKENRSFYKFYKNGLLQKEKYSFNWKLPGLLGWVKDVIYTFLWVIGFKGRFKLYVGANNLNAFCGLFLRKLKKTEKVVFYTVDYIPNRFGNKILNAIYHWMDRYCIKHCDMTWNLSENMSKARVDKGMSEEKQIVVPIGVQFDRIKRASLDEINRKRIVYMGHLRPRQGIELIIEAMKDVIEKIPDIKLIIIGMGQLKETLKQRVKELALEKKIEFAGFIEDHKEVEQILASCAVGLAPYEPDPESFTWYADPSKPKQYMASGLPVIITRVAHIAEEVEKRCLGIVVDYNEQDLAKAIIKLVEDETLYVKCRENAIEFSSHLSWDKIFENAFEKTLS
ncbi:MAG: glycosyltransferase [Candidatus Omnitrophica bacterium]|nr:glycosyltransferase [Candidatus Omnitrophota bacterium]